MNETNRNERLPSVEREKARELTPEALEAVFDATSVVASRLDIEQGDANA